MIAALIGSLFFWSVVDAANLDAKEIVKRADDARLPNEDVSFQVQVDDFKGAKRIRQTKYQVWAKGNETSLVDTVFPERQKGRKLLMKGDDLWFFTPDIQRPTRVSMQQRLTGEVANGDIVRTNFYGDYDAKLESDEKVGKSPAFRLTLTANRKGVTYEKIHYWVSKDKHYLPLKAEFFAMSGKMLKRASFSEPKNVLGRKRVTKVVIEDAVEKARRSVMIYSRQKREKLDDSMFNKDSMSIN